MPAAPLRADSPAMASATPSDRSALTSRPPCSSLPTIGVEEEFLLVDRSTGLPVPVSGPVLGVARSIDGSSGAVLQHEVLRAQVETATPVCSTLSEVVTSLQRSRRALAVAAEAHHVSLAAVGTPPDFRPDQPVTASTRYLAMRRQAPVLLDEQLVDGMHVHVAVPTRESGVRVLNHLRPYLPALLAFSANSPFWHGRDTGFASWRGVHMQRWPVEGAPPRFRSLEEHDRHLQTLLRTGVIMDLGMVYWQARLSERHPTVEVRVCDVALDVESAAAITGLVRGLVVAALADEAAGRPSPRVSASLLRAASWQAARSGLETELVAPDSLATGTARMEPAETVVLEVASRSADHLGEEGGRLLELVRSVLHHGNGARRQRAAFADGGLPALMELVCQSPSGE